MKSQAEYQRLLSKIPEALATALGIIQSDVQVSVSPSPDADGVVSAAGHAFLIEFKMSAGAALVASAAQRVRKAAGQAAAGAVPLLVVPFMGEVGRRVCKDAGVSWLDLSGNAHIMAPGLRVIIGGQPNRFPVVGRPPNLFAPKSSRIVRWLLIHPDTPFTQREIARATDMYEGFVSRLVSRLEQEGFLVRQPNGGVKPKDPGLLLDAWREAYRFSGHTLHQGHVPARSGDALLAFVCDTLKRQDIKYAATGLAAAWVLTRFAAFRLATVYLATDPTPSLKEALGFREDSRGANLWLVAPNDNGVFQESVDKDGIHCVHPVQVYMDLKGHPERSAEAAERLRSEFLR